MIGAMIYAAMPCTIRSTLCWDQKRCQLSRTRRIRSTGRLHVSPAWVSALGTLGEGKGYSHNSGMDVGSESMFPIVNLPSVD